mgnify:CR=1 FL=1
MICFLAGFAAGIFTASLAVYFKRKKPADDKVGTAGGSGDLRRRQFANLMYYNIGEKGVNELEN